MGKDSNGSAPNAVRDRRQDVLRGAMQRFDFVTEIDDELSSEGTVVLRFIPDPRRYDRIEEDGEILYVDRYTRVAVSLETLRQGLANHGGDVPSFFLPPRIGNTLDYAAARFSAVQHEIATGEHLPPEQSPLPHRPLELPEERPVTFISLDICGATRMRVEDPAGYDRAFGLTFQELAATVNQFYGSIHKTTGDGFIAYVDHPSVTARDSAVDLGLSLLAVLRESVNVALERSGLKPLTARVGADHGPARMHTLRSASTGFSQQDVVSDALNRAVKLQEAAAPGTMLIGEALREQLHVGWLERCEETEARIADAVGLPGYRSFTVR